MWDNLVGHLNPDLANPWKAMIYSGVFLAIAAVMAWQGKTFFVGSKEERRGRAKHVATIAELNTYFEKKGHKPLKPLPDFSGVSLAVAYFVFAIAAFAIVLAIIAALGPVLL